MLVSIAIACTIAVALHLWAWLEPACANENRRIVMKATGGVGCFEFWLYRYQGLLGNVLTAAVAGITLIWIARQLTPANRQASVAAAQGLRVRAEELRLERALYEEIRLGMESMIRFDPPPVDLSVGLPTWRRLQARVQHCKGGLARALIGLLNCKVTNTTTTRDGDLQQAIEILIELQNLIGAVEYDQTIERRQMINVADMDFAALEKRDRRLVAALAEIHAAVSRLSLSTLHDGARSWEAIRRFEDAATR